MKQMQLRRIAVFALTFWIFGSTAHAATYTVGQSYYDTSGQQYIEYIAGSVPIVISAPHGGTLEPVTIPDRADSSINAGCPAGVTITTARDTNTHLLAKKIQTEFYSRYGVRPHVIVAHIARKKVDLNRDKPEAACGNAAMEIAWTDFHNFVKDAMATSTTKYGKALYIDLHGHAHTKQRLELGYRFTGDQLRSFNTSSSYSTSSDFSLDNLPRYKNNQVSVRELLFGNTAFGTYAANRSLPTVPSAQDTAPAETDSYFNGGFNTSLYTGSSYLNTFGWQIETNWDARKDDATQTSSGRAIADAIVAFLKIHHNKFVGTSTWRVPSPK